MLQSVPRLAAPESAKIRFKWKKWLAEQPARKRCVSVTSPLHCFACREEAAPKCKPRLGEHRAKALCALRGAEWSVGKKVKAYLQG